MPQLQVEAIQYQFSTNHIRVKNQEKLFGNNNLDWMSLLAFCGFSQKCQEIMKPNQCAQKFTTGLRVFPAKQLFMGNVSLLQKQVWKVFKHFDEIIYNFRRFVWYTRCRTKHVKLLLMLFCFSACVTLPIFLIYQSIDFYYNTEVINFEAEEKNIHISHAFQM